MRKKASPKEDSAEPRGRSSIWKGSIRFGLLNIPVTLQTAQQDKEIHFSMLDEKNKAHIKYQKINAETGKEVPPHQIVKAYEYEHGKFVIMKDSDFRKANVKATQTMDIEDFVLLDEVDPLLYDKPYYIVPQKGAEKGYFLLRDALNETKKVAVVKIVIRIKQHLALIMPKDDYLVLEILRFAHEIKAINEAHYLDAVKNKPNFSVRELKMAEDLIKGMTAKWHPEKYKDTYYDDLMKLIKQKVKQGPAHDEAEEDDETEEVSKTTNVVDLMPLLKKSLEAAKPSRSRKPSKKEHATHSRKA